MDALSRAHALIQKHLDGIARAEEIDELDRLIAEYSDIADAFARATRREHLLESHFRAGREVEFVREMHERSTAMKHAGKLIQKHIDRIATLEETVDLERFIAEYSDIADAFARATRQDHFLESYFLEMLSKKKHSRFGAGVKQRKRASTARLRVMGRSRKRLEWREKHPIQAFFKATWPYISAAAAVIAFFVGHTIYTTPGTQTAHIAQINKILDGNIQIIREGETISAKTGDFLFQGDLLLTNGGRGQIHFLRRHSGKTVSEETSIDLNQSTQLELHIADDGGKRLNLRQGVIYADVAMQSIPMMIETPNGRAEVRGTKFELAVGKRETILRVAKGNIRFTSNDKSVQAWAGNEVRTRAGEPPEEPVGILVAEIARWRLPQAAIADDEVVFEDDFEDGWEAVRNRWRFVGPGWSLEKGKGVDGSAALVCELSEPGFHKAFPGKGGYLRDMEGDFHVYVPRPTGKLRGAQGGFSFGIERDPCRDWEMLVPEKERKFPGFLGHTGKAFGKLEKRRFERWRHVRFCLGGVTRAHYVADGKAPLELSHISPMPFRTGALCLRVKSEGNLTGMKIYFDRVRIVRREPGHLEIPKDAKALWRVTEATGACYATRRHPRGLTYRRYLLPGDVVAWREVVVAGDYLQLRGAGGLTLDLDRDSRLRLKRVDSSVVYLPEGGRAYLAAPETGPPIAMEILGGGQLNNLSTPFGAEFSVTPEGMRITVDKMPPVSIQEAKARLVTARAEQTLSEFHQVLVSPDGTIGEPKWEHWWQIASWKFRRVGVSAGTVLLQDDFEKGMDRWRPQGDARWMANRGMNNSACVRMRASRGNPASIAAKVPCRWKNYQVEMKLRYVKPSSFELGAVTVSERAIKKPTAKARGNISIKPGSWGALRWVRRAGRQQELYQGDTLVFERSCLLPAGAVVFVLWSGEVGVDDFVITKLED